MSPPRLQAVLLVAVALLAATAALSLASSGDREGRDYLSASPTAVAQRPDLERRHMAKRHRARPALGKRRAVGGAARGGLAVPVPGSVAAAPAPLGAAAPAPAGPESEPAHGSVPSSDPGPSLPPTTAEPEPEAETPTPPPVTPPTPPANPPANPAPEQPAPPATPAEPVPAEPGTPAVEPGVPLEPETDPKAELEIGIDGGYAGWSSSEVRYRTELGAAVTRHEWDPARPVDAQDDVVLTAAGEIHTRIHALLGGNQLGDPTHYREWVVDFVRYYGPGGSFWSAHPGLDASRYAITSIELGNEPYFGAMSPRLYAETVLPALERIKALGLPVKVFLPANVYGSDTSWVDVLYDQIPNLNSLIDGFAFHPYWYGHSPSASGPGGPLSRIETVREAMDEHGADAKPIWLTEYGESTASCGDECVSEAVQAEHLREMLDAILANPAWKVEMLSVFQLIDRGTGSSDRELQFGLLRQNGTPKPSYPIVRAAMGQYR